MKRKLILKSGIALAMLMAFAAGFPGQTPGTLDGTFGTNGMVLTDVGNVRNEATSVAIQPDGKIITGGSGPGFTIFRYNVDGSLDSSFGIAGVANRSVIWHFRQTARSL